MKYGYTIIYVSSVEETLDFYKKAFGFDVKFIHGKKGTDLFNVTLIDMGIGFKGRQQHAKSRARRSAELSASCGAART
ncbi:VOC family protein [Thiocystis violacea]|uniref:VOC family protein n=1 Tax=Thiocystis violacea TaxID=13725 RepID=UPI0019034FC1|nr:VOC family protein [Thiocystis violacea]